MSLERIKNLINNTQSNGNVPETAPEATINVVKNNQNIFEENKTSYNQYNQTFDENWEDVEFTQDKALGFLWNVNSYTYTTSNGSTITVKDTDGITVKQNKQTGEIVIIGGNVEDINLSDKNNLTLIEANAKNINAKQGDATIKIEGSHTSVANVTGGKGSQSVIVSAGAKVEHINTGDGDDTVIVNHSTVGKVETGSGSDGVIAYDSTITNNMDLGKDNDYALLEESSVQGKLIATKGSNTINANESELNGKIDLNTSDNDTNTLNLSKTNVNADIDAYNGNADITIENNSTLAEDKKIRTGYGNYNVTVNDSNLDGNFVASGFDGYSSYETLNLNLNNSSFNNISGLRDDDSTTFNSANSKSNGAENVSNSAREVVSLDISKESEFEGFELIKPDSDNTRKTYTVKISETQTRTVSEEEWKQGYCYGYQLLSENVQNIYTLADGTQICMNEGGEVYTNENGEIVINGADKAEIIGSNSVNSKITVINSNVLSHNNVSGNVEYRNSNVDTININDNESSTVTIKDDSRIGSINSNDSNITVNISDTSKIDSIVGNGDGLLNIVGDGGEISSISSKEAMIVGNIQNTTIGTVKTTKGSIDITAYSSKIDKIENKNKDGVTKLDFTKVNLESIVSSALAEINLNNCTVTSKVKTSDKDDILNLIDSEIKNIETKQGKDNIYVHGGEFEKLTASGMSETTLDGADIDNLNVQGNVVINKSKINSFSGFGNIAIKASEIEDLNVYGDISNVASNVFIEDSLIKNDYSLYDDNAHIDYFGETKDYGDIDRAKLNSVQSKLDELSEVEFNEIYALLGNFENVDDETLAQYSRLSKEEIIQRLNEAPSETLTQIKQGLIDEMLGSITTLEQALEDDKNSGGSWWLTSIINSITNDITASNIQAKKEMLQKAIENGDIESLLNARSILTDEISATNAITEYNDALTYANSISNEDIGNVLTALNYIGNLMEYNITEQDGVIKNGIAYLNMYFDIGTNRAEAQVYVQTFKDNVKALTDKYNAGTLSKEELVSEYKRLTGNSFTEENIQTILDNKRGNDAFSNKAQEKIEDYQSTQQQIFQVGEYAITIVAGSMVTLASGGAAGPAIAASLSALGKMGIALTATTVSFLAKTAIEATERQTNGLVADDMTAEEIATSAALMYAGCLCGRFGNAVGDYIRGNGAEFFSQFISSKEMVDIATKVAGKTLEIGADTGASVLTTAMITGSGSFNEEFMQNLRSEMIGLIQSKITGAYFKAHPELQINTQLYSARKALTGVAEAEANIQVLKQFGFDDTDAVKLSTLTSDEVDTIVVLRATNDLCEASLKAHGIDISKLSTEEKFEQGKIVDDLYANTDSIKQETSSTCSVVSVLNAINEKPVLVQALINKFEYDASSDTYKFNMFGEDFEVKLAEGDNLLQKAYEAYQITFGDTKTSAIDVFNGMLDGASDIIVRPSVDNIAQLKAYSEDDATILTFNTTDKIDGITEGHSYTVLSVDDMGNMKLQDPETLEEITLMRSQYENKDCQIQGKTYKDSGLIEDGVELKLAAGSEASEQKTESQIQDINSQNDSGIDYKQLTATEKIELLGQTKYGKLIIEEISSDIEDDIYEMGEDTFKNLITILQNDNVSRMLDNEELNLYSVLYHWKNLPQDQLTKLLQTVDQGTYSELEYYRIALPDDEFKNLETLLQDETISKLYQDGKIDIERLNSWANYYSPEDSKAMQALLSNKDICELINAGKISAYEIEELAQDPSCENTLKILSNEKLLELVKTDKISLDAINSLGKCKPDDFSSVLSLLSRDDIIKSIENGDLDTYYLSRWLKSIPSDNLDVLLDSFCNEKFKELIRSRTIGNCILEDIVKSSPLDSFKSFIDFITNDKITALLSEGKYSRYHLEGIATLSPDNIKELIAFLSDENVVNRIEEDHLDYLISDWIKNIPSEKFSSVLNFYKSKTILDLLDAGKLYYHQITSVFIDLSTDKCQYLIDLMNNENVIALLKDKTLRFDDIVDYVKNVQDGDFSKITKLLNSKGIAKLLQDGTLSRYDLEKYIKDFSNEQFDELVKLADSGNFSQTQLSKIKLTPEQYANLEDLMSNKNISKLLQEDLIPYYIVERVAQLTGTKFELFKQLIENENVIELVKNKKLSMDKIEYYASIYDKTQIQQLIDIINQGKYSKLEILRIELPEEQFENYQRLVSNEGIARLIKNERISDYTIKEWAKTLKPDEFKNLINLLSNKNLIELMDGDYSKAAISTYDVEKWVIKCSAKELKLINELLNDSNMFNLLKEKKITTLTLNKVFEQNTKNPEQDCSERVQNLISLVNNKAVLSAIQNDNLKSWDIEILISSDKTSLENILALMQDTELTTLFGKKFTLMDYIQCISKLSDSEISKFNRLVKNKKLLDLVVNKAFSYSVESGYDKLASWCKDLTDEQFENLIDALNHEGIIEGINRSDGSSIGNWSWNGRNKAIRSISDIAKIDDATLRNQMLEMVDSNPETLPIIEDICDATDDIGILKDVSSKLSKGLEARYAENLVAVLMKINTDLTELSSQERMMLYYNINRVKTAMDTDGIFSDDEIKMIDEFSHAVSESLKHTITPTEVTPTQRVTMMKGFFANNNSSLDKLLSTTDFTQFGKTGLPLEYPRNEFLSDLNNTLKNSTAEEKAKIFKKLGISVITNDDGKITGYNGIIDLTKLSDDGVEAEVLALATKFIKENSILTGNTELDNALNSLIQGMPEFINVIGKQQHETQNFSVDVHILTVLKEAMANPEYQNLSNLDKTCLKFATIMHDIAKSEDIVDKMHPDTSALYARNIMEKYTFPDTVNDRIYELVKNHHWLEKYSNSNNPDNIAALFRHKDDYSIARIMAEADLKGVSDEFYANHADALKIENLAPVTESLEKINSKGQIIFTSKIIKENLIPRVEYNGKTYKVVDFTSVGRNQDLSEYGFTPNTTYGSLRLYIHMADSAEKLETVDTLSDVANGGFLCVSYISLDECHTYGDMRFGVSLEGENVNIANASDFNQSSGCKKDFGRFSDIITGNDEISRYRDAIPNSIKRNLGLNDTEYAELYEQLAQKQYITQIRNEDEYIVNGKKYSGYKIRKAIMQAEDSLIARDRHNESNIYNPKINAFVARVDSIEEIPESFLNFALEYDLPIYLLGK